MTPHEYKFRVKYSETDKMGFVHHSNYVKYYENARWETMRQLGIPYSTIESKGIFMPVIKLESKFIKPAFYDDELTVTTTIKELSSVKISFQFNISNSSGNIINNAMVSCAFIDSESHKVRRTPEFILEKLKKSTELYPV
ncbi:MAG: thioesterase family protein [Bacteroidota bacterium]